MHCDGLDVLVTGGAGFIGSHVVDRLVARGHRPRIFDQRPSPWHSSAAVDTCIGDLGDLPRLRAAMDDCDVVVHLAGERARLLGPGPQSEALPLRSWQIECTIGSPAASIAWVPRPG